MSIELYAHNRTAYDAAVAMLTETGKAAVIHPTGTGKSFIGFKYCEDNPSQTVCWLSPSEYIFQTQLENLKKSGAELPKNIIFFTYARLMNMTDGELADISPAALVLDEFHRAGAPFWGGGVQRLLELYPDVPMLGLSATNIRYLDNQRDMAEELFDGNIASEMTLGEAIVRGILKAPKYVVSLYSYQKDLKRYEHRVRTAKNKAVRDAANAYLEAIRRALEKADGLDVIFQKHIENTRGKYLVFCSSKRHMDEMLSLADEWFGKIDPSMHIYKAYSSDPETSEAFRAFKADKSEHLKLLYCIDMLNEGIHVEDVSGVILFRPTVSPIIYKQQIGRALTAGNTEEPVIFDIVNNFENLYSIGAVEEEMQAAVTYYRFLGQDEDIVRERFRVIDEVRECKSLFDALNDTLSASWDIMYEEAKRYYDDHGDLLPTLHYKTPEGYSLGAWLSTQRSIRRGTAVGHLSETQIAKLDAIGMRWETYADCVWNRNFDALMRYYEEHGDVDIPADHVTEDGIALGRWVITLRTCYNSHVRMGMLTPERIELLDAVGMIWDKMDFLWERNYQAAARYYEEHRDLRVKKNYRTPDGIALGTWLYGILANYRQSGDASLKPGQKERLEAIGFDFNRPNVFEEQWDANYEKAKAYYQQHGNLEVPYYYKTADGFALGLWISRHRAAYKRKTHLSLTDERIEKLNAIGMVWDSVPVTSWEAYYPIVEKYYREHGNLNIPTRLLYEGVYPGQWLSGQRVLYRRGQLPQDRIRQLEALHIDWMTRLERLWEESFAKAERYYKEHGDLDARESDPALYNWLRAQRKKYREYTLDESYVQRLSAIGMVWELDDTWELAFAEAEKFYQEHGHLDIPAEYVTENGVRLGNWYRGVRGEKRRGTLSQERQQRLEAIGIQWLSIKVRTWMQYYELCKAFYEKHGNLNVHADYQTTDGTKLGVWVSGQRYAYSKGKLSQEQIALLEQIGMSWQRDDSRFEEGFIHAKAYQEEHGDLLVNSSFVADDGFRLGAWIATQRTRYKAGKLNQDRIDRLEALGMVWSRTDEQWETGLRELRQYQERYGTANAPYGYVTESGFNLGAWLGNQRSRRKAGKLSDERIQQLNALNMRWGGDCDAQWNAGYSHMVDFKQTFHHARVPVGYVSADQYNLGNWLNAQKRAYKNGRLGEDRCRSLRQIGVELR